MNIADITLSNSEQLDAVDIFEPALVSIKSVTPGIDEKRPAAVKLHEYPRPWYPCLSVRRLLISAWGGESEGWVGKYMIIHNDQSVEFGNKTVGGIRITAISGIPGNIRLLAQEKRGKIVKVEYKEFVPSQEYVTAWSALVKGGKEGLKEAVALCKLATLPLEKESLRRIYRMISAE
jgi:hypothetical protein